MKKYQIILTISLAFIVFVSKSQIKEKQSPHFNKDSTMFWWCSNCDTLMAKPGHKIKIMDGVVATDYKTISNTSPNVLKSVNTSALAYSNFSSISHENNTIKAITYCINTNTLKSKWFKLKTISGFDYPSVQINSLIIYNKWLNVPKGYKAVYSIAK